MKIINSIGYLRNDLIAHGWHMTAFSFRYNSIDYDVLFENNDNFATRTNPYASVTLHFIDVNEPQRTYDLQANQIRMFFDPREFRNYFHIEYTRNLGDIFQQFFDYFLKFVPQSVPKELEERQNHEIDHCLAGHGNHNPAAIYCYDARRLGKRNGRQMNRSIFISNLTQRRKPRLYAQFKCDPTITFYYSDCQEDERDDIKIIDRFIERESSRRKD